MGTEAGPVAREKPVPDENGPDRSPRRWWALAAIAIAQLVVVLDATVVTIALPSAQRDLHISDADRQWVVTAYTLAFGGLLLLGGRIADYVGRKRIFLIGLLGFAAASAVGGAAPNAATLFGFRAAQGLFAAILAPAALSLITVTFVGAGERARAFVRGRILPLAEQPSRCAAAHRAEERRCEARAARFGPSIGSVGLGTPGGHMPAPRVWHPSVAGPLPCRPGER